MKKVVVELEVQEKGNIIKYICIAFKKKELYGKKY